MSIELKSPKEAHYTVYKLTDPAGMIYIGCTGRKAKDRWDSGWGYSKHQPFYESIKRYGWKNIKKEILCEKLTREGAEKLEAWFVDYFDSMNPEKGYNIFSGGNRKGAFPRKETREKMRQKKLMLCFENNDYNQANKLRIQQYYLTHPERRAEISGQMHDYLMSPEGRKFVESDSRAKPVRCVETGEVFRSAHYAEKVIGRAGVHKACSGKQVLCNGCHWEYVNVEDKNIVNERIA